MGAEQEAGVTDLRAALGLGSCSKTQGDSSVTCAPRSCPTPQPEASGRTGVCRPCALGIAGLGLESDLPPQSREGPGTRPARPPGEAQGAGLLARLWGDARRGHPQTICRQNQGSAVGPGGRERPRSGTGPGPGSSAHAACPSGRECSRPVTSPGGGLDGCSPHWAEVEPLEGDRAGGGGALLREIKDSDLNPHLLEARG